MPLSASKKIQSVEGVSRVLAMKGSTTIHRGALAVADANGWVAPGTAAANLTPVGMAYKSVANAGADGAASVEVKRGTYLLKNDGGNPVTRAHVGKPCYIVDDETVSSSSTDTSAAGTVFHVTDAGVWVTV